MSITTNKYHPRTVEWLRAVNEGRQKVDFEEENFNSLLNEYLCAIDYNFSKVRHSIELTLEVLQKTDYIVPYELLSQCNPSMFARRFAVVVKGIKNLDQDYADFISFCYKAYFPPSYGFMIGYVMALAFGMTDVADKLKNTIKSFYTVNACMPYFLKRVNAPDILQKLEELNELTINEDLENGIQEDIEKHDTLNPVLFEKDKLKPEIRDTALQIVDTFIEMLEERNIPLKIHDIILTGSNANYNYTKDSDIDLHIQADLSQFKGEEKLYAAIYEAYKSLFNTKFEISIYGIPLEIYVENIDTKSASNGIYSIKDDRWVKEPEQTEIPEIDMEAFQKEYQPWEERALGILEDIDGDFDTDETPIDEFIDDLYELRIKSLADEGEYSFGNLIFKELRNRGYLDQLKTLKDFVITNKLSLK